MNRKLKTQVKKTLSKLLPDSIKLRYLSHLPKLETFRKSRTENYPVFDTREKMYDFINTTTVENGAIVYCEFGVYEGESIEYWTNINRNVDSRFYGFDTFTGLPNKWENFLGAMDKKTFDVSGEFPKTDDSRVSFIKGMFQDTLPQFLNDYDMESQLIIHNDSDLYSSTLYVLTAANGIIRPGTIIIFDEFSSMLNEFRALEDYCSSYIRSYEVIAATTSATSYFAQIAIRIV